MNPTFQSITAATSGLALKASAVVERRRMLRQVSRFSNHRLHDIGFERDWDGSILRNGRAI
ncbi:DUF1127 domain-containing protein [Mesorhizobium sp. M7A.F.Ca.US.011.01.1.1]|uniref:DUF1127 domain-containing protein n=1 Tax=Mesorhizobium sp. M7A.F.Ca.US.011.01.1.1 TaxID=2496741 RepID=UPI000FC9CC22|nr:DUF1127 domain-containing protein [Mesorhizobium sp. M7A.F.Ca.US.011.01.1.1]RUX22861.1 DUF1127 domain-containing protein [Mesorhizobium sp. M7A.F.Ca.US.011.01.1.1]